MVINDLGCSSRRWATTVGQIIRLADYLTASRHGIFYFRYPLPIANHPARKREHVKVSLRNTATVSGLLPSVRAIAFKIYPCKISLATSALRSDRREAAWGHTSNDTYGSQEAEI